MPDTGRVVMSHNPDTPRSPASTIKTVTTFAALDMLGPAFIWQTRAWLQRWRSLSARRRRSLHHLGTLVELRPEFAGAGLEFHCGRHRHRQQRVFPAEGGCRRLRRPAESRVQRRARRVDGEFPIDRLQPRRQCRNASRGNHREPGTGQSRGGESHSVCARPLRRPGSQSGFSSCLVSMGPGGFFRSLVPALRAENDRANFAAADDLRLRHLCEVVAGIRRPVRRQVAHRIDPGRTRNCFTPSTR